MVTQTPITALATSPVYPNSVRWSEDNLLAVAAGHLVFIINPANPSHDRGIIVLPPDEPFPIGVVQRRDLSAACLLPICLSRESLPCARSISWSPLGLASIGCLLAVCTTEGHAKIYHAAHGEPYIEWTEVLDISAHLCNYYTRSNFTESNTSLDCNQELGISQCPRMNNHTKASHEGLPVISATEYAYRKALMSSLIVAWSPLLDLRNCSSPNLADSSCTKYAILGLGGKSGRISFWKIPELDFSVEKAHLDVRPILVELLTAHNAWVTTMSWEIHIKDALQPQLVLVTGSSDGSVKVWVVKSHTLTTRKGTSCFSLLKELRSVVLGPISVVSLIATESSHDNFALAVGQCSGSVEVWKCDISSCSFERVGTFHSHDQVITGLGWAHNERCLYSCSMDNSLRSWALHGDLYSESHFPQNSLLPHGSNNVMQFSGQCFGLAVSPGNLVVSVAHALDPSQLDPMYEAKSQKAAIEFLWTAGRPLLLSRNNGLKCNMYAMLDLSEKELAFWRCNVLQSLMQYEDNNKHLVIWDVLFALMLLKQHNSTFVDSLLSQWLMRWLLNFDSSPTVQWTLSCLCGSLSKLSIRKLHLLNVICRRLMLADSPDIIQNEIGEENDNTKRSQTEIMNQWKELAIRIEREIRERLVAFSFKAFLTHAACQTGFQTDVWLPSGIAQMEQWVLDSLLSVSDELKLLASKITELANRVHSFDGYKKEETCGICSAMVPFISPEVAICRLESLDHDSTKRQRLDHRAVSIRPCSAASGHVRTSHELKRCSVTMQICSISPLWHCRCCQRSAEQLLPEEFFTTTMSPLDTNFKFCLSHIMGWWKPSCPLCGVLLQRSCGFSASSTTV